MDCGTFRENHTALIDDAVCDADLVAMQRHVSECADCAAHDTTVRRALLLFRNMPTIEPSSEFSVRLDARLRDIRAKRGLATFARRRVYQGPGVGTFAGLAAGVIAAGYLTVSATTTVAPVGPLAMAPVVATAPALDPATELATDPADVGSESDADAMSVLTSPAFIASVSTGSPVWPATVLAARAPARLAAVQLKLTSLGR
jgi:tetrahydromethanopterin S-methyltransferase subunit F